MRSARILDEIMKGPKTVADLREVINCTSGQISASCQHLLKSGKIKRVDGNAGVGAPAVYAPLDFAGKVKGPKVKRVHFVVGNTPPLPGVTVHRDPCFFCGVRGDVPCKHDRRPV